jgi:hypothetical protein
MFMSKSANHRKPHNAPPARPRWLLPGALLSVGLLLAAIAFLLIRASQQEPYTPEVSGAPNAELDQTVMDYGDVPFNKPVEAIFNIRNTGDQPLQILGEARVELLQGC